MAASRLCSVILGQFSYVDRYVWLLGFVPPVLVLMLRPSELRADRTSHQSRLWSSTEHSEAALRIC